MSKIKEKILWNVWNETLIYFFKVFLCRNKFQIGLGYLLEEDKRETTEEERFRLNFYSGQKYTLRIGGKQTSL